MIEVNNHSDFLPKHPGEWRWVIWGEKQDSGKIRSWILDMGILRCPKVEVAHKQLDCRSGVLGRDPEAWTRIKPCALDQNQALCSDWESRFYCQMDPEEGRAEGQN